MLFLIAGMGSFLIAYAIYYIFKDDKSKEWQLMFLKRGADIGLAIIILSLIFGVVEWIITGEFPTDFLTIF